MKHLFFCVLLLCGCPKAQVETSSSAALVAAARTALAERERRLTSFTLVVDTTEGDVKAHHDFAFRSPNKSRGHLTTPQDLELAFDGTTLVRLLNAERKYEVLDLAMPAADRAYFLASTFMPFVPEGFRSPLLPLTGVEGRTVSRPNELDLVELTVKPAADVTVHYLLRVPAGDFLEKRTLAEGQERVLRVEAEHCDAALKLCVPTKLVDRVGDTTLGTTVVTEFALNTKLPQDHFSPQVPAGWAQRPVPALHP